MSLRTRSGAGLAANTAEHHAKTAPLTVPRASLRGSFGDRPFLAVRPDPGGEPDLPLGTAHGKGAPMRQGWSVHGHWNEFGRGRLFIDGTRDESCRVKFNRPNHEFKVEGRRLVLKTTGGIGELWSRNILIPPSP